MEEDRIFPEPFSDQVWQMILFNGRDPPMICMSLKRFEKGRIDDLRRYIEEGNWKESSYVLNELKMVARFDEKCHGFLKK